MKSPLMPAVATALVLWVAATPATAGKDKGTSVNVRAEGINTTASDGGTASVTVGGIEGDADVQGVTVINGRVSIDGKEIPAGVTRYKSPRTGTIYKIERKNGAVNVVSEGDKQ